MLAPDILVDLVSNNVCSLLVPDMKIVRQTVDAIRYGVEMDRTVTVVVIMDAATNKI
jgi:hypothetical protein